MDCKNFEGSDERIAIFHKDYNLVHMKQAANATISGAVGSSGYGTHITPKKRKNQEMFPGKSAMDQTVNMTAQYLQVLSLHSWIYINNNYLFFMRQVHYNWIGK